jgi:hypothetical protein
MFSYNIFVFCSSILFEYREILQNNKKDEFEDQITMMLYAFGDVPTPKYVFYALYVHRLIETTKKDEHIDFIFLLCERFLSHFNRFANSVKK